MKSITTRMKNKFITQTCVFDLASRTIMPKKVLLKDFQIAHFSVGSAFSEPVYVQSFVKDLQQLTVLCKQGMFEALKPLEGSLCSFRFSDSPDTNYLFLSVSLHELCYLRIDLALV